MYVPMIGGTQSRTKHFAEKWVKDGYDVTIIVIDHLGTLLKEEKINDVRVLRIHRDSNYYRGGVFGRKLSTIFIYTFKLWYYLLTSLKSYDVIIFNQFPILPVIVLSKVWMFKRKKPKIIIDFVEFRNGLFWRFVQKTMFLSADKIVCISDYILNEVCKYNVNCIVVPNCIDISKFNNSTILPLQKQKEYVFVGRIESHKHPELAIEAVKIINQDYLKAVKIGIVGDGTIFKKLKQDYPHEYVHYYGFVSEDVKAQILQNSRILIIPSEREGLPTVVIEAIACNIPVVTTDFPNNGTKHFVVNEGIGLVADPFPISIAEKILEIENNYIHYQNKCNSVKLKYDLEINSKLFLTFCEV